MEENKKEVLFNEEDKTIVIDGDELRELEESTSVIIEAEEEVSDDSSNEVMWKHADADDLNEIVQEEKQQLDDNNKKKKRKKIFLIILILVILLLGGFLIFFLNRDKDEPDDDTNQSVFNDIKVEYQVESPQEPNGEWYVQNFDVVLKPASDVKEYYYCVTDSNTCEPNIKIKGSKKTTITINQNGLIHKVCGKTVNNDGIESKVNCSPVYRMDKDKPVITVNQEELVVSVGQNKEVKDYFTITENTVSKIIKVTYMLNDKEIENLKELDAGIYEIVCTVVKENQLEENAKVTVEVVKDEILLSQVAKVGDYVAYDAGKWSNSASKPEKSGEFGGYKNGASKSESVACSSGDNSTSQGFRILKVEEGVVTLVHAGTPECYYHDGDSNEALTNISSRIYGQYYNSEYAQTARGLLCADLSSFGVDETCSDTTVGDLLVNVGSSYWLGSTADETQLSMVNNYGKTGLSDQKALGIRPVVVLRTDLKVSGGDGSSYKNAYQIER